MARPTKEEVKKRDAAKKRVDELFGNIVKVDIKDATQVVDKLNELQSDGGGNQWLQDQVTVLSEKNKALEDELIISKDSYNKILESKGGEPSVPANDSELQRGIRLIFDDMRNNYEGKNQNQTKYEDAKIHVMLDKFLRSFPFLLEGRK